MHDHLRRIRQAGILAPEPLGVEGGHEQLRYIPGHSLWSPGERCYLGVAEVIELGGLLRRYHDAAVRIGVDSGAPWNRMPTEAPGSHDLVCHNDVAPWNVVRNPDGLAIIDWDLAAPGNAAWDVAYAAWATVPLWNDADLAARGLDAVPDRPARLTAFADAYGADAQLRSVLLSTVQMRLEAAVDQARQWAAAGRPGWDEQWSLPEPYRHGGGFRRDVAYLDAHESELQAALDS